MASFSPEVIPECEILGMDMEGDEEDRAKYRWENCKKNPGHPHFIPVNEFRMEHLPVGKRTPEMMDKVFRQSAQTVRIRVAYTSKERPDTFVDSELPYPYVQYRGTKVPRFGTGTVQCVYYHQPVKGMRCPCPECKDSENPRTQFWWIQVQTSTHVIYDRSEGECAEFECFYDSEDKAQVKKLYGFDILNFNPDLSYRNDIQSIVCVTHDIEMVAILKCIGSIILPISINIVTPVIVSHPHGRSKHITVGDILHATVPIKPAYPVNTPMAFGKGMVFREKCQTGLGSQTDETEPSEQSDLFNQLDDNDTTFRDRLEAIQASLDLPKENNTTNSSSVIPPPQTKDDYWEEFYKAFQRNEYLTTAMLSAIENTVAGKSVTTEYDLHAIDYVSKRFLGLDSCYDRQESREENSASESEGSERDKDVRKTKADENRWGKWEELFMRSEELYVQYLKYKTNGGAGSGLGACGGSDSDGGTAPIIVGLFEQIGDSMDSIKSELANKGEIITFNAIIKAMGKQIASVHKWIKKTVDGDWNETETKRLDEESCSCRDPKQKVDEKKSNHSGDGNRKKEENREDGGSVVGTVDGKAEREKEDQQGEGRGDSGVGERGGTGSGGETMWFVPEGARFILPSDAEYTFRSYPRDPRWINFPPGTKMTHPDGADLNNPFTTVVGEPHFQFCQPDKNLSSHYSYLTYTTDTCPGSSGASVFCDMLEDFQLPFPHAGGVIDAKGKGVNQSGSAKGWKALV